MPNKTLLSVNKPERSVDNRLNPFVLGGGAVLASLGAMSAMLLGGPTGNYIGCAAFILLLGVLLFVLRHSRRGKFVDRTDHAHEPAQLAPEIKADLLVLSVSELGRVRWVWGNHDLAPELKPGQFVEDVRHYISANSPLYELAEIPSEDGALLLLKPKSEDDPAIAEAVKARTNFFAGLGHDLKSPLNAVIGFSDIMDAELKGPLPEAYADYPGLIRESGETLLRLVEDILDYARSEAGTYELDLSPVDIAASGESVMRQSRAAAGRTEIELEFEVGGEVLAFADASAVRRIWDNLVSNAIKYSNRGGKVSLSASVQGERAILSVADTGAGMDAEDLARVAEPFEQGRNAKGRAGTGLGLAMVRKLAELHGGLVRIETAPGAGTKVSVSLPLPQAMTKQAAE